ncbi:MAG: ATP-binding cassette domain-containing protein [Candidatus Sericytochromatia bacterium]
MIIVDNVSKSYPNQQKAVANLSFTVPKGAILGFLGPNGAGKTTTMRMITGFMAPSEGRIEVAGFDTITQSMEARRHIGYLPETPPLYNELSVSSYLDFVARIKGMRDRKQRRARIQEVAAACWIEDVMNKTPGKLSKGYRQRVGLAQALIHNPDAIILDEPTIGLDPRQIQETRKLIKSLGGQHTVILSTHILPEVQMTCDQVIIINKGQIVAQGTPEDLIARSAGLKRIQLRVRGPEDNLLPHLRGIEGIIRVELEKTEEAGLHYLRVESRQQDIQARLAREIVENGWDLFGLQTTEGSLEDVFIQLVTKEA